MRRVVAAEASHEEEEKQALEKVYAPLLTPRGSEGGAKPQSISSLEEVAADDEAESSEGEDKTKDSAKVRKPSGSRNGTISRTVRQEHLKQEHLRKPGHLPLLKREVSPSAEAAEASKNQ